MRTPAVAGLALIIGLGSGLALGTVGRRLLGLSSATAPAADALTAPAPPALATDPGAATSTEPSDAVAKMKFALATETERADRAEARLRTAEGVLEMVSPGRGRPGGGGDPSGRPARTLQQLGAAIETAKLGKDGDALLAALREAMEMGAEGLPVALALMNDLRTDLRGENLLDLSGPAFRALLRTSAFAPLHRFAIERPDAVPAEQVRAVWTLAFSAATDTKPYFGRLLQSGVDESLARNMISALGHDLTQESVQVLLTTLEAPATTAGARKAIADALRGSDRPESIPALERLAFEDADPKVRDAARSALTLLRPPVAGYGITGTRGHEMGGDAAGLKPGDIVMAYNGAPVTDAATLRKTARALPPTEMATIRVYRDGQTVEIQIRGGRLPAFGRFVAPK